MGFSEKQGTTVGDFFEKTTKDQKKKKKKKEHTKEGKEEREIDIENQEQTKK